MTTKRDQYSELAEAIGEVCIRWADIEAIVHDFALHLAAYHDRAYDRDSVIHPLHVALSHMKLRERIFVVKALADAVKEPEDYYDRLAKALSVVDNDLTIERNRFVHDTWEIDGLGVTRFAPGPKVVRPQAGKRALVMGTTKEFLDLSEVRQFLTRLEEAACCLVDLDNELAGLTLALEKPQE